MDEYIEGEENVSVENNEVRRDRLSTFIQFNYLPVYIIIFLTIFYSYIGFFYLLLYFGCYSVDRQRSQKEKHIIIVLVFITIISIMFSVYSSVA